MGFVWDCKCVTAELERDRDQGFNLNGTAFFLYIIFYFTLIFLRRIFYDIFIVSLYFYVPIVGIN